MDTTTPQVAEKPLHTRIVEWVGQSLHDHQPYATWALLQIILTSKMPAKAAHEVADALASEEMRKFLDDELQVMTDDGWKEEDTWDLRESFAEAIAILNGQSLEEK